MHELLKINRKLDNQPYWPDLAPCDLWLFSKMTAAINKRPSSDGSDIKGMLPEY